MNGKLITLEGVEGTGKSTQIAKLADYLHSKGIDTYTTQEPGGTRLGEEIRRWLLESEHPTSEITELLLFYAARTEHQLDYIAQLNRMAVSVMPDLTILLDMDPKYIWQRLNIATLDRFERENEAFFTRVRQAYLQCAKNNSARIKVVNAEQSIVQVTQAIIEQLKPLIGRHN